MNCKLNNKFHTKIKASIKLHKQMIYRILRTPINLFLDKTPIGRIINRLANDLMSFDV